MSDEAKRIAHRIAADLLDPDDLTDIIGDYEAVTEELFPAVREALLELRQELLEDIDEDVMTPEEEAEIDAILDKYRGADGKISLELVKKHSRPLTGDLLAEFNAVAYDDEDDSG